MNERTLVQLREIASRREGVDISYGLVIPPCDAQSILDMISDLRYAGEAVDRAYRQCEPDPRQLSLVSRYADVDPGALPR